jgi:branched-chain amino acid aminotransferase
MSLTWIDGHWGSGSEPALPLLDRGLQLADGLFETVLVQGGHPQLLAQHLARWHHSAQLLGMEPPPSEATLRPLIAEAIQRSGLSRGGSGALRLNWSRGQQSSGAARGIGLPGPDQPPLRHRFWLQLSPCPLSFTPLTAMVSQQERRNASSLLSRCKTFAYGQAIQARREAQAAGAEEALLLSSRGDLCCASTANLLVQRRGQWLTPPLASGCLPGVMRQRALELGLAQEAPLAAEPEPGDRWLLLNSLSCRPLRALDGQPLTPLENPEGFWAQLQPWVEMR